MRKPYSTSSAGKCSSAPSVRSYKLQRYGMGREVPRHIQDKKKIAENEKGRRKGRPFVSLRERELLRAATGLSAADVRRPIFHTRSMITSLRLRGAGISHAAHTNEGNYSSENRLSQHNHHHQLSAYLDAARAATGSKTRAQARQVRHKRRSVSSELWCCYRRHQSSYLGSVCLYSFSRFSVPFFFRILSAT